MEEKLRAYMDSIFRDVKTTRQSVELREEILQNLIDKYHDLIGEGKTPEAAYNIAIASIGDVEELLAGMGRINPMESNISQEEIDQRNRTSGALTALAVVLYITSVLPPILLSNTFMIETLAPAMMFMMIAAATGILIYNNSTRPRYHRADDSIVEDFKEWNHQADSYKQAYKAISSALWSLTVVVYILVSFTTMAWHITWVIFLISAAIDRIIKAVFELKGK